MVDLEPGTVIRSSKELILVILRNLVGNAVKFSKSGTIRIGLHDGQPPTPGRVLWVSDEGPGIPQTALKQIFEAFERGGVQDQPGVGLGLAIASQSAKLLRAELGVTSTVGEGSTFWLRLRAR